LYHTRKNITLIMLALFIAIGWHTPHPTGLSVDGWHCLIIFIATIMGIVSSPLPISVIALLGATIMIVLGVSNIQDMFICFGSKTVWIVILAFFIAKAFIKTGLGKRIAYIFIARMGHNIIGLAYGLLSTEWLLAPLIPSITARSGGIVYPIAQSIIAAYSDSDDILEEDIRTTGAFLMNICQHGSVLCSAMFLTSMAANPMIVELASTVGIHITWGTWTMGALLPGAICLFLLPFIVSYLSPPGIRNSTTGPRLAQNELDTMGPMTSKERIMLSVFIFLILGWISAPFTSLDPTTTTLMGVLLLIITDVLDWNDAITEKTAWDTMVWFSLLLALANQLEALGVIAYLAECFKSIIDPSLNNATIALILCASYFYVHYFFASLTAHITVFYVLFLKMLLTTTYPPLACALILAYLSNLFGGLTHYGTSAAPIFYGSGYQNISQWWFVGIVVSSINFVLWISLSLLWLPLIGLV